MTEQPLAGKKIAIVVEHKFIPEEIEAYRTGFALLGADVTFVSRLWYGAYQPQTQTFYSDVDPTDSAPWESPHPLSVHHDLSAIDPADFAAVIMTANYTSVRLRWDAVPSDQESLDARAYVQSPPTVQFFAALMRDRRIVKGVLCHGLWILTPHPELLQGRRVTCNMVMMADVLNCGAEIVFDRDAAGNPMVAKVVVDDDLVTGYSKHEVLQFIAAVSAQIQAR